MTTPVQFMLTPKVSREKPRPGATTIALRLTGWNDYDYQTTFQVFVSVDGAAFEGFGEWKILDVNASPPNERLTVTRLPARFTKLPAKFLAVAQDSANYAKLAQLNVALAQTILKGLRDVAFTKPKRDPEKLDGFHRSLVRFAPARFAYTRGRALLAEKGIISAGTYKPDAAPLAFSFTCKLPGFGGTWTHDLDLAFSRQPNHFGLRRMWALVGTNGAGKTLLLASLARNLSGLEEEHTAVEPRPALQRVVAVSYGPWDNFTHPKGEGHRIPYVYCGLRAPGDRSEDAPKLDVAKARHIAARDLRRISKNAPTHARWKDAMRSCGLDRPGAPLSPVLEGEDFEDALRRSSAGEQFAAIVVTRLVRHIERETLVLFDEPELHMHPSLLSGLLRTLHDLLVERDAFAIVATHSPIPLQEIPGSCVRVLDVVEGIPHTRRLDEQSFGASLGDVVAGAFRSRQDHRNWVRFIRELISKDRTREEIIAALDGDAGLGVEMLLTALVPDDDEGSES